MISHPETPRIGRACARCALVVDRLRETDYSRGLTDLRELLCDGCVDELIAVFDDRGPDVWFLQLTGWGWSAEHPRELTNAVGESRPWPWGGGARSEIPS
jgi:hypothetical protein